MTEMRRIKVKEHDSRENYYRVPKEVISSRTGKDRCSCVEKQQRGLKLFSTGQIFYSTSTQSLPCQCQNRKPPTDKKKSADKITTAKSARETTASTKENGLERDSVQKGDNICYRFPDTEEIFVKEFPPLSSAESRSRQSFGTPGSLMSLETPQTSNSRGNFGSSRCSESTNEGMEIILFDSENFVGDRFESGDTFFKIQLVVNEQSITVGGNSSHEEYKQKVMAVSKEQVLTSPSICIHVNKNPTNAEDFTKCLVRMHGFLQDNLDSLWVEGLKVRIQVSFLADDASGQVGFSYFPAQFYAEIPIDKSTSSSATNASIDAKNESCCLNGLFSEAKDVQTHNWQYALKTYNCNSGKRTYVYGCVAVSLISDCTPLIISANDQLALFNIEEQGLTRICKKILHSKIYFDFSIVAKDGTVVDCNKNFLAAQSDVLATMLETDMKEAKTNQIEMKDMTAIGVKALLEYIYTLDLDEAFENCDIALELLQAGFKYDIKSLEKQVSSIIVKKEFEWFTVDMAFSLFLFARKFETMEDIKLKAVSLLMTKSKEFMECQTFTTLFQENSALAAKAAQELFCLSQAK